MSTMTFGSPEALAAYMFWRTERYAEGPAQKVYLALMCAERAERLYWRYA